MQTARTKYAALAVKTPSTEDLGSDVIYGGPGDDHNLYGGNGNDVIHAGPGDDDDREAGFSEYGDDVIYGGDGDDWITSGAEVLARTSYTVGMAAITS